MGHVVSGYEWTSHLGNTINKDCASHGGRMAAAPIKCNPGYTVDSSSRACVKYLGYVKPGSKNVIEEPAPAK